MINMCHVVINNNKIFTITSKSILYNTFHAFFVVHTRTSLTNVGIELSNNDKSPLESDRTSNQKND